MKVKQVIIELNESLKKKHERVGYQTTLPDGNLLAMMADKKKRIVVIYVVDPGGRGECVINAMTRKRQGVTFAFPKFLTLRGDVPDTLIEILPKGENRFKKFAYRGDCEQYGMGQQGASPHFVVDSWGEWDRVDEGN